MDSMKYHPMSFEESAASDSAFLRRLGKYDVEVGKVVADKRKWQIACFAALLFCLLSYGALFYALSIPKTIPMIIKVAPWGQAEFVGDISQKNVSAIPETSIKYYIENFVSKTRSVSSDLEVIYTNLNESFAFVSTNASAMLTDEIKKNNIVERVGESRTKVIIETTIKLTSGSWQVDWVEEDSRMDGRVFEQRRYRGVYQVKIVPANDDIIRINPLGIFIDSYELQEIR